MELQIDLESPQEYYDIKIQRLWNQAQEAEHLAEFGPGEDMMFINDLCGEQDRKKIKTMRERERYIHIYMLSTIRMIYIFRSIFNMQHLIF